jgi:beta-1,4-mannosyltransferase
MASELERMQFLSSLPETTSHVDDILSGRCRLVVSSTSWTPDEDFSVLLDALCQYSAMAATSRPDLPDLLVIITGKGPQKAYYLSRVATLTAEGKLAKVKVETAWLSHQHYASLLAAACLGVCLHTSSSGVDLPMKVVDMFGAGLPVLGWNRYPSWPELVTEEVNGRGFGSSNELLSHLVDLFDAKNRSALDRLRAGALAESRRRWDGQWDPIAGKLLQLT